MMTRPGFTFCQCMLLAIGLYETNLQNDGTDEKNVFGD